MAQTGYQTGYYNQYNAVPVNGLVSSSGGGGIGVTTLSISQLLNLSISDVIGLPITDTSGSVTINTVTANDRLNQRFKATSKLTNQIFNINQPLDIIFNIGADISSVSVKECKFYKNSVDPQTLTGSFVTNGTDGNIKVTIPSGSLGSRNMVQLILDDWCSVFYKFGAQ